MDSAHKEKSKKGKKVGKKKKKKQPLIKLETSNWERIKVIKEKMCVMKSISLSN